MTTAIRPIHPAPPRPESAASVIAALRSRAEAIRSEELSRQEGRWDALSAGDRLLVETLTRRIVDALLSEPAARLAADPSGDGADLESARFLFDLGRPERGVH